MTSVDGGSLATTTATTALANPGRLIFGVPAQAIRRPEQLAFGLPLTASVVGLVVGGAALLANVVDAGAVPSAGAVVTSLVAALAVRFGRAGSLDRRGVALVALWLAAGVMLLALPEYLYGGNLNGIIHRSAFSGPLLLILSVLTASYALRSMLGASPTGRDLALYPVLALPVVLALVGYAFVLGRVVISGIGGFQLDLLTTAWKQIQGDAGFTYQLGFLNNILGTFLLIAMTLLIAFLPGVGAGVFMNEYPGRVARVIDFCTTMLRAVSMFIIGAAAFGVVHLFSGQDAGTFLSDLFRGSYQAETGSTAERGSFLTASIFLALLVIPLIAKLTEEGLRSVPNDLREASVALGATDGHGLRRILLPWAAPNILTGILLAGAEAAGSLAVIMFLAGMGEHGVGPLNGTTSLDYAVFATKYGTRVYKDTMHGYQSTAALLLLVLTLGLTVLAMLLQRRFAKRYRGSLTAN